MDNFEGRLITGYSVAFAGITGSLIALYSWLGPGLLESLPWNVWALLVIVLAYAVGLLIRVIRRMSKPVAARPESDDRELYQALLALMRAATKAADYREVVRLGDALGRPLFESGEFAIRLELGRLTEEAAAHIGAREVQYRTLIDTIGWSLIELGDFPGARKAIKHGLTLAEETGDPFYRAKAYRHLGAIERRKGQNDAALKYYEDAKSVAAEIPDRRDSDAMMAGITYAIAHLEFSRRNFKESFATVSTAVKQFSALGDIYRLDMALVLKADIQVALEEPDLAKDTYRKVIQSSRLNRESVHYARAVLGLVELYIDDGKSVEAKRLLSALNAENVSSMPAFAERFKAACTAVDPPETR